MDLDPLHHIRPRRDNRAAAPSSQQLAAAKAEDAAITPRASRSPTDHRAGNLTGVFYDLQALFVSNFAQSPHVNQRAMQVRSNHRLGLRTNRITHLLDID